MHAHILGICGTFMGGVAQLAKEAGIEVSGCDANVYPPMSTQLEAAGIELQQGYDPRDLPESADVFVVGNAMSRGNPAVEAVLNAGSPYVSGPQWLADTVLKDKWVLAVAGTHGKTTTSSMLAWILEYAGMQPGFLIGGVPENFGVSARMGGSPFFVVEADEYDTAFFDKRSKFVHYRPRTLIMNNLEFDHADIFDSLSDIQRQFHHVVRTVPEHGRIISNGKEQALEEVLEKGCWTPVETFAGEDSHWRAVPVEPDASAFEVYLNGKLEGCVYWPMCGEHNMHNGLAAIAAARHVGVLPEHAVAALGDFKGVKRRLQCLGEVNKVAVYDDFAHHPTAIATTLDGMRKRVGEHRVIAVLEPRSNTMKMGVHKEALQGSLAKADAVFVYQDESWSWQVNEALADVQAPLFVETLVDDLVEQVANYVRPEDHVVVMSNGGFSGFHQKLLKRLQTS